MGTQSNKIDVNYVGEAGCAHLCKANWNKLKRLYLRNSVFTQVSIQSANKATFMLGTSGHNVSLHAISIIVNDLLDDRDCLCSFCRI